MSPFARSIRDKLTPDELRWLYQEIGLDLTNPELVEAVQDLWLSSQRVRIIFAKRARWREELDEAPVKCSFCESGVAEVGALARAHGGAYICEPCARQCIEMFSKSAEGDA